MGCFGECWEMGPPPDSILNLPPPPIPAFLQHPVPDLLLNTTPCSASQICESVSSLNKVPTGNDFVEMSRKEVDSWSVSTIDDTWLLVLVASSIGVLLLGALLAMFLLKCREMNMFDGNDCSMSRDHRPIKNHETRECSSVSNLNSNKLIHPSESVMYHGGPTVQDNRMVWAALTPHGTQHFISENYPRDLIEEDHYETVDNLNITPVLSHSYNAYSKAGLVSGQQITFDNCGFVDYDYEDPTPLIESYQMNNMEQDMRCASLGLNSLRRVPLRPRVSSPTRIEHPNLPPLNLYPHKSGTLKRGVMTYRNCDSGTLPKYGC